MQTQELEYVFTKFAGGNVEMDGRQFTKTIKDAGLVDKTFTTTDVDIIFAKAKDKSHRKITFAQFEKALGLVATKRNDPKDKIITAVQNTGGPKF
mmetsp:Transcript_16422/g.14102  ORF Transcript_16422/g.14102 Transcript_16422/m.14102 type:complete len:95 (-) Transcript_16422:370-654(-)